MSSDLFRDVYLLGQIAGGDRRAFAELFDRHSPVVLGVLTRLLGRREEAEEVLQEAFLQAWRQAGNYRPERASPRGWLLMLARSRALDRIRASRSRAERESATAPQVETAPVGTRGLEEQEAGRQISRALSALPNEQRQCIELSFYEGLSHSQIAERLREPLGTIKSRIALGMRKMRSAMEPTP